MSHHGMPEHIVRHANTRHSIVETHRVQREEGGVLNYDRRLQLRDTTTSHRGMACHVRIHGVTWQHGQSEQDEVGGREAQWEGVVVPLAKRRSSGSARKTNTLALAF